MKKLLFLSLAVCVSLAATSQLRQISPRYTNTNADTSVHYFTGIGSKLKTLQISAVKVSGTTNGKVYVEGTVDDIGWFHVDSSFTPSNVSGVQTKEIAISATKYFTYRCTYITSGTQVTNVNFSALRRPDE